MHEAQIVRLHEAFRTGDLAALRAAADDPAAVPNGPMPPEIGNCLEYAIYHSPLWFIQALWQSARTPDRPITMAFHR